MADTDLITQNVPEEAPEWFRSWAVGNLRTLKKTNDTVAGKLLLGKNLNSRVVQTAVKHDTPLALNHNLDRESKVVIVASGRLEMCVTLRNQKNRTTIRAKLLTTYVSEDTNGLVNQVTVYDTSLLEKGDVVFLRGKEYAILNKAVDQITLSGLVEARPGDALILARENATFLIL